MKSDSFGYAIPRLVSTQIRVQPDMAVILATRVT
jgi:hypothetical protein